MNRPHAGCYDVLFSSDKNVMSVSHCRPICQNPIEHTYNDKAEPSALLNDQCKTVQLVSVCNLLVSLVSSQS